MRDLRPAGGHQYRVVRSISLPPDGSVIGFQRDIVDILSFESVTSFSCEIGQSFNCENRPRQRSEDSCLITRSGADLENLITTRQIEDLRHSSDDERL